MTDYYSVAKGSFAHVIPAGSGSAGLGPKPFAPAAIPSYLAGRSNGCRACGGDGVSASISPRAAAGSLMCERCDGTGREPTDQEDQ